MTDRTESKLMEMVVRGTDFKDDFEVELYGEPVTVITQPLVDNEFLPLVGAIRRHVDIDEEIEDREEAVSEAVDKVEEAKDPDGSIDMEQLDETFVELLQKAAGWGIYGSYDEDDNAVEHTDEEIEYMINNMMGGYSVEIGAHVLEISGDVRDAEKFRGGRGSVDSSRSE